MLQILFGKFLPFCTALLFGIFVVSALEYDLVADSLPKIEPPQLLSKESPSNQGVGSSGGGDRGKEQNCFACKNDYFERNIPDPASADNDKDVETFQILSKPRATYTEAARENSVEGSVRLKVILLASGQVGSITTVSGLPFGLTEQAIAAARQIKFRPKMVKGRPLSLVVTVDYKFSIY